MATQTFNKPVATNNKSTAPLQDQFCLPQGLLGRLVGWFMTRENQRLNRLAVEMLAPEASDDVLEIGFGPGHAIKLLVEDTPARWIAGVDPSDVMAAQACARNRQSVESGRVQLVQASVENLPFEDGRFSKVVAVSNFEIWASRRSGVAEVRRVLRPGGLFVICVRRAIRPRHFWNSPGITAAKLTEDRSLLAEAGFTNVRQIERTLGRKLVCLLATA